MLHQIKNQFPLTYKDVIEWASKNESTTGVNWFEIGDQSDLIQAAIIEKYFEEKSNMFITIEPVKDGTFDYVLWADDFVDEGDFSGVIHHSKQEAITDAILEASEIREQQLKENVNKNNE